MSSDSKLPGRSWQRTATEDLWERTLNQIETRVGRLAYLSRLRNAESDRYEHHGLIAVFGVEAAEDALRKSHQEVLVGMLNLSLLDQKDELLKYIQGLPQSPRRLLANWEKNKEYEMLLPRSASSAQRELFEGNIRLIIQHLKVELDGAENNPKKNPGA